MILRNVYPVTFTLLFLLFYSAPVLCCDIGKSENHSVPQVKTGTVS